MSTADLAVIAMAVVSVASIIATSRLHMKVADRLRLVNPPKQQPKQQDDTADTDERPLSILGGESTGEVTAA